MLIAERKKKYTIEDYLLLEEGAPFQLIENNLVMSPSPNSSHQLISGRLLFTIMAFLEKTTNNGFIVTAPMDVILDEDNAFQPDLVYVSADRREEIVRERIEGAPDMIIEILFPSNAYYDLRQKKNVYEKHAVKEYIIIDPVEESAELYLFENSAYTLKQKVFKPQTLNSVVLPGLSFDLNKVFN